ncbi:MULTISPECIES: signal peptidase I [unclassified Pseudonocardia]|uniref:signal peptidase I n=1 Tax=unclassified Pseudonocardia TaxID=2619320 RepID=UPI00095FB8CF|nr:signal peptidase I [Pseudonocardia sp. Ae707_Ps1]OLM18730.1 Signal peptidase I [Pseudonocardia sp. Ae707_Ps1]
MGRHSSGPSRASWPAAEPAPRRSLPGRLVGGLVTLLVLAAVAVAVAVAVVPAATGSRALTVLSGSMVPTLPVGSLVVSRPVDPGSVVVGDVVSFVDRDPASGETRTVTHRVVEVAPGPVFTTRGDANAAPDPHPVTAENLLGRLWYHLPWVGGAAGFLRTGPGLVVGGGAVLLLIGLVLLVPKRGGRPGGGTGGARG